MVNKKGEHVDWIISIGIFLIYLLGMFVIIKPGIIPIHNYNTLLDIAEEHLKNDVQTKQYPDYFGGLYWTLNKIPLFISESADCVAVDFPYDIDNSKVNVYSVSLDPNGAEILAPLKKQRDGYVLYVQDAGLNPDGKYVIYFSDNEAYDKNYAEELGQNNLFSESLSIPSTDCVKTKEDGTAIGSLGIMEKIRGVSEMVLALLRTNDPAIYEKIKEIYTYPKSKEFSILITSGDTTYDYKVREPGVKTNVYTRQWGDFILNYDGKRKHVQVSVKVW